MNPEASKFLNQVWQQIQMPDEDIPVVKAVFRELRNGNMEAARATAKGNDLATLLLDKAIN